MSPRRLSRFISQFQRGTVVLYAAASECKLAKTCYFGQQFRTLDIESHIWQYFILYYMINIYFIYRRKRILHDSLILYNNAKWNWHGHFCFVYYSPLESNNTSEVQQESMNSYIYLY